MNSKRLVKQYLNSESKGFIEPDDYEQTHQIKQIELVDNVDITSSTKHFDLQLDYGPYRLDYFRNGRNLLIASKKGHVAALDWLTKNLTCEFNVRESIHDLSWLQLNDRFAIAQKDWTYIYDDQGTEMHVLRQMYRVFRFEFLPYHYLLVGASDQNFLTWLDVSTGQTIKHFKPAKTNKITNLTQNPANAIVLTSHYNGSVSMWSPNMDEAVAKMLCHGTPIKDLCVDSQGKYLVTAGVDRKLKLWDLRTYKNVSTYRLSQIPNSIAISQQNILAVASGEVVNVFKDCFREEVRKPYLKHHTDGFIDDLNFCNYEDVLGMGHEKGFTSILVPGAGEPNFDSYEANPFLTNRQRKEQEVKNLLDKIPAELISLDPNSLAQLNGELTESTKTWKFDNTELIKSLAVGPKSKKIKLSRDKKLKILEMIRKEKKDNINKFKKRKIKRRKSRFASKNREQLQS